MVAALERQEKAGECVATNDISPLESQSYKLEKGNSKIVRDIYNALRAGDIGSVRKRLAGDVDWWFHGPRRMPLRDVKHFQMMPRLVGASGGQLTAFEPLDLTARCDKVFVEGLERAVTKRKGTVSWVHVWTLKDGAVTGLREYVNTAVYAAVRKPFHTSLSTVAHTTTASCADNLVWESKLWRERDFSTPGLILTI